MSKDKPKDYYNIGAMSSAFRKWDSEIHLRELSTEERFKMWELRFSLTIAQQLSVIAAHLGKIVGKAENGKAGDGNDQG